MFEFYLFGLQRSGTNYFSDLMSANFNGIVKNNLVSKEWANRTDYPADWKHNIECDTEVFNGVPIIVLYKNPYTWIESICFRNSVDWVKRQKHYPAATGPRELQAGKNNINVGSLAKSYKHWFDSWIGKGFYEIRYEDLLPDQSRETILADISVKFDLLKPAEWKNILPGKVSQSKNFSNHNVNYYLEKKSSKLTKDQLDHVNSILTYKFINDLGYKVCRAL